MVPQPELVLNGVRGAGFHAHPAADAFGVVGGLGNVYVHLAGLCTGSARDAFVGVYAHLEQRDLVQQRIERAQRVRKAVLNLGEQTMQC